MPSMNDLVLTITDIIADAFADQSYKQEVLILRRKKVAHQSLTAFCFEIENASKRGKF